MLGDTTASLAPQLADEGDRTLAGVQVFARSPRRGGPQPPAHVRDAIITTAESATTPRNVQKGMRAAILVYEKGIPYVWGGHDPNHGLDCSGFTQYVLRVAGANIARVTYDQVKQGRAVAPAHRQPLDLCFYEPQRQGPGHVVLYMGGGWGIHEPHTGLDAQWVDINAWRPITTRRYIANITPQGADALPKHTQPAAKPAATRGAHAVPSITKIHDEWHGLMTTFGVDWGKWSNRVDDARKRIRGAV